MKLKIVAGLLALLLLGAGLGLLRNMVFSSPTPIKSQPAFKNYESTDLTKDKKVTTEDAFLLRRYKGCRSGNPCWKQQVGTTTDNSTPIYASDLDVNGDGELSDADINAIPVPK